MGEETDVVWVLGAGFSQPLGGPLLGDLISQGSLAAMDGAGIASEREEGFKHLVEIYQGGVRNEDNSTGLWRNPEEALERLESAGATPKTHLTERVKALVSQLDGDKSIAQTDLEKLAQDAKRFVAQVCGDFTRCVSDSEIGETEQWSPVVRWVEQLTSEDMVITFNYDDVLDRLSKHLGRPSTIHDKKGEYVCKFVSPIEEDRYLHRCRGAECSPVRLLQLHGCLRFSAIDGVVKLESEIDDSPLLATRGWEKVACDRSVTPTVGQGEVRPG